MTTTQTVTHRSSKLPSLALLEGGNLSLARAGTFVTVEEALVTQPDVAVTNGVVHVIDKVLIPPKR